MAEHTQTTSAKILAFPAGGRRGLAVSATQTGADVRQLRPISIDAWYHQAALAEDERKH